MLMWLTDGRIVDLVLAVTLVEALVLGSYHHRTGRGLAPAVVLALLLPGVCLMLALRAALIDAWPGWIAFWLAAAFAAHLLDLRQRWPR
jgi:hypothetical protein